SFPLATGSETEYRTMYKALSDLRRVDRQKAALPILLGGLEEDENVSTMKGAHWSRRSAACFILGRLGPAAESAVPSLLRMLEDEHAECRMQAARALGWIGPAAESARPILIGLEEDQDSRVRRYATIAVNLIEAKQDAVDVLMTSDGLKSQNHSDRALAA